MSDILGIEWDPVHEGFWVTDWNSDNIALLDRNFNLIQLLTLSTPSGFSSGITPMNDVAPGEPYQIWVTDFTSDQTTVVESLTSRPTKIPTLSEWGIILMTLFLGITGLITLRRRALG